MAYVFHLIQMFNPVTVVFFSINLKNDHQACLRGFYSLENALNCTRWKSNKKKLIRKPDKLCDVVVEIK